MKRMSELGVDWCTWCDRPRSDCWCYLDPAGIPEGHWSIETHTHVWTSELGWHTEYAGKLVCSCGDFMPYQTPLARGLQEWRSEAMTDSEGLKHDLCWMRGETCHCIECDDARSFRLIQDMRMYWDCRTIGEVEARRKAGELHD